MGSLLDVFYFSKGLIIIALHEGDDIIQIVHILFKYEKEHTYILIITWLMQRWVKVECGHCPCL